MLHKVICVDDDPIALLLSKLVITKAQFAQQIITAANGYEAIKYLDNPENLIANKQNIEQPLLVMLDLNMPVMDGWEFLDEFTKKHTENYKNVKIILLSSSIDPNDIQKAKEYPIVLEFYPKPLSKEIIEDIKNRIFPK